MKVVKLGSQAGYVYAVCFRPNPGSSDDSELVSEDI